MRILVAHLVSSARTGGMSRLMGRVHDELEGSGHHVTYLSADDVGGMARGRGGRFLFPWSVRRAVVDAARRGEPYDVVNVHEPHGAPVAAFRTGQNGTAVVAMTHGVEQRGWELSLGHEEIRPSLKTRCTYPVSSLWQSRMALTRADHVICLNTDDREFLHGRFGVDRERITRITPGADAGLRRSRVTPGIRRAEAVALRGHLDSQERHAPARAGVRTVVRRRMRRSISLSSAPAHLPIAFGRDFDPTVRDRVTVINARDDRQTAEALAAADIFVLPSLFEGTPLTLIEAMWSGLPVVTTATAGMKDVVRDDENGLLVQPGSVESLTSAIERLARDAELRRRLGIAAHQAAVERYTWRQTAAAFEAAYRAAKEHRA